MCVSNQPSSSCLCGTTSELLQTVPTVAVSFHASILSGPEFHPLSTLCSPVTIIRFFIIGFMCAALSHHSLDFTGLLASSASTRTVCSADARRDVCAKQTSAATTGCVALGAHRAFLAVSSLLKDMTHSIPYKRLVRRHSPGE